MGVYLSRPKILALTQALSLGIGIATVSDTRTKADDKSGGYLAREILSAGHKVCARDWVIDDKYRLRALISAWIIEPIIDVIITTGGTGLTGRDSTPEAIRPLLDKEIEGFGELFRAVSLTEIGSATVQSRTLAGLASDTLIFCLPGSQNACRTGWEKILKAQLDSQQKPCNFAELIPRFLEN